MPKHKKLTNNINATCLTLVAKLNSELKNTCKFLLGISASVSFTNLILLPANNVNLFIVGTIEFLTTIVLCQSFEEPCSSESIGSLCFGVVGGAIHFSYKQRDE